MNWKAKVSKRKVLLFQLAVKVHGIKENVSGSSAAMYPTPTTFDQYEFKNPRKKSSGGQKPPLTQVVHMMYGTPKAQDERAALWDRGKGNLGEQVHGENNARATGLRLSANFVEFLMGYPQQWTKIEPTELKVSETQSFHKSQEKSD